MSTKWLGILAWVGLISILITAGGALGAGVWFITRFF